MANATHPLIAAALAMPKTHKVVTTHIDGRVTEFETRNEASAQNHAAHMRFRCGKSVTVTVLKING